MVPEPTPPVVWMQRSTCELVGVSAPGTQAAWSPDEMSYLTNGQNPPGRIAPNVPFVNNHYVSEEVAQAWMFGDGPERMCYCEHCVFAMAESGDIVITQCGACVGQPRELTPRVPAAHASESAGYMVAASDGSQTRVGAVGGGEGGESMGSGPLRFVSPWSDETCSDEEAAMARGGGECPAPVAPVHDLRTPRAELEPSRARDAAMNGSSLSDFVSPVQMQMLAPVAAASNGGDGTLDSHVASPAEIEDAASMYCGLTVSPGKTVASVEYLVDSGANVHLAQTKVIADNSVRVDGTSKQVGSIRAGTSLQTDGIIDSALAYKSVTVPMRQLDAPGARSNVMSESALIKSKGAVIVKSEEHSFILYQGGESARALVRQLKESGVAQPMVESNGLYRATFELKTVEMTANAGALTAVGDSVSTTAAAGAKPAKQPQSTPVPS